MADLGFLKKTLPWIGAAASAFATGGPAGLLTVAAKGIGQIVSKQVAPTADSIAAAVTGATPEQLIEMKKLDQDYALQMQKLGFENEQQLEQIAAADRASAREREKVVKDKMPAILAILAVASLTFCICLMAFVKLPDGAKEALLLLMGFVGASYKDVYGYFFGSSAGSAKKDETISVAMRQP